MFILDSQFWRFQSLVDLVASGPLVGVAQDDGSVFGSKASHLIVRKQMAQRGSVEVP